MANLYVLTAGTPSLSSVDLLGSANMRSILDQLRERYDIMIIDTPPILEVTDAETLASMCDGVVFVVRKGRSKRGHAQTAMRKLEMAHADVIGVVLNRR